jgi:cobalt-zinc-cadmium efflux system outer membrane protein
MRLLVLMILLPLRPISAQIKSADATPAPTPISASASESSVAGTASSTPRRLTLEAATDLLIKNNLAVMAARYNIDILRAQRIAAGLRPNPSFTLSATQFAIPGIFHHPSSLIKTNTDNGAANTTYTVEVDQLIERGGKRALRMMQADLNTQAAQAQLRDALRQQIFQLNQAFFSGVLARENLRVARENLNHFTHTEEILRVQYKEGATAGVDLKRIELQQLQFEHDVATAEQSYQQATRDVLNLIGQGDAPSISESTQFVNTSAITDARDADFQLIAGDLDVVPLLLSIDELRKLALNNRPDVKAAQFALDAAQANQRLAQAQRTRDITVGGQYSHTGSDHTVGVIFSVPLAVGRRADAAIAQAVAARLQAEAQLRQTMTQALTDVEKAFVTYRLSRDRLRLFTGRALQTATEVRRIEEIAYEEGAKGLLDFLDAQRAFNQTQMDYNQARYDFLMSLYQLEYATGTPIVNKTPE